eukprot:1122990-Ditylum_brightwellii.AAC.1
MAQAGWYATQHCGSNSWRHWVFLPFAVAPSLHSREDQALTSSTCRTQRLMFPPRIPGTPTDTHTRGCTVESISVQISRCFQICARGHLFSPRWISTRMARGVTPYIHCTAHLFG